MLLATSGPLQAAPRAAFRAAALQQAVGKWRRYATAVLDTPVVIVGAGPTGLTLSCLLSSYGVPHMLLERASMLTQHPQAHFINNRTMEVFRGMAGLSAEVAVSSPPLEEWRRFVYCESMLGRSFGEVDHFKGQRGPRLEGMSPEPVAHLPQHRLLPLLLKRAVGQGSKATVLFGHAVTSVKEEGQGMLLHGLDSQQRALQLRCSYVVAADGANSSIRRQLGIPMEGTPAIQQLINIHFRWPQLGAELLRQRRPAMLYFVFNADVVTVVVAHNLQEGEFVAQVPYFPPLQSPADFPVARCQGIAAAAAGGQLGSSCPEVLEVRPWRMSAQVAASLRHGRVFLAGDAAHRFPPAGGMGMNTGIQDAHNLAWKLAAVLCGTASEQLLDSYQLERRPVALANTALSVANWQEAVRVPSALGLDPRAASLLDTAANAAPLPEPMRKALLEAGLAAGRGLAARISPWREAALKSLLESGESLRLQFPREDLGFQYTQGAVDAAGAAAAAAADVAAEGRAARGAPFVPCVPCVAPGFRMPHCELELQGGGDGSQVVSTLDLVGTGGCTPSHSSNSSGTAAGAPGVRGSSVSDTVSPNILLLLSAASSSSAETEAGAWAAAGSLLQASGWPLNVLRLLRPGGPSSSPQLAAAAGAAWSYSAVDAAGTWHALLHGSHRASSPGHAAAVLVRPDGHIAWVSKQAGRHQQLSIDTATAELQSVLKQVLCMQMPQA